MVPVVVPSPSLYMFSKCSWCYNPWVVHTAFRSSWSPNLLSVPMIFQLYMTTKSLRCQLMSWFEGFLNPDGVHMVSQSLWCPHGVPCPLMSSSFWFPCSVSSLLLPLYFSGCGGDFTGKSGSIISPNYPRSFPSFSDCVWRVKAPISRYISLRFQEFTGINGTNSKCLFDSIEIREGHSNEAPLIGM